MNVFTYGTLMFPEVWQAVAGRPSASINGQVSGFAIYRVRDAVFPGIVATTSGVVQGVVYLDVDDETVRRLDRFEDDFYERQPVTVDCDDGTRRQAEAYVVPDQRRGVLTDEIWSPDGFAARGDLERFLTQFAGFRRLSPNADPLLPE
jgi:gamma-glutamylcyclotransferase (GGCT)/AIG2-like uncharacterized protein YtfP